MSLDAINAAFECGGGLLTCINIARLLRDKCVRGVHPAPVAFFSAWGLFNTIYYPSLGQWWSFAGGLLIVTANTIWVVLMLKYRGN